MVCSLTEQMRPRTDQELVVSQCRSRRFKKWQLFDHGSQRFVPYTTMPSTSAVGSPSPSRNRRRGNPSSPNPISIMSPTLSAGTSSVADQCIQQISDAANHQVETKDNLATLLQDKLDYIRKKHLPAIQKDQWKYDKPSGC